MKAEINIQAENLLIFFNKPLHKVNKILLSYAISVDVSDLPEWMRGKTSLSELPRFRDSLAYTIGMPDLTASELGECCVWIVNQLAGNWCIDEEGFHFENENEAIIFKLSCWS